MTISTGTPPASGEERVCIAASLDKAAAEGCDSNTRRPECSRRFVVLMAGMVALCLACCAALATSAANAETSSDEELASIASPSERRASATMEQPPTTLAALCRAAQKGEPCHSNVIWAMETGIKEHEDWYLGLTAQSRFEDFQAFLALDPVAACPRPCASGQALEQPKPHIDAMVGELDAIVGAMDVIGYPSDGRVVAQGQWCTANEPQQGWSINGCGQARGVQVKILTYNLFWWNLFGKRQGAGGSAGKLIAASNGQQPFDFMGFQECENVNWVIGDAGLLGEFETMPGPHAMCMAYRKSAWQKLADSSQDVGEDRWDQWYGTRAGMWARLQHHETGQVVFFLNHHGPLPVHTGGMCGGEATAFNLLKLIASNAHVDDVVILVGDFNAGPQSQTVQSLQGRLHPVYTGTSFGGVDNVLSSCANVVSTRNLGSGGSDHDALEAVLQL